MPASNPEWSAHSVGDESESATAPEDAGIRLTLVWIVSCSFIDQGHDALLRGEPDFEAGELVEVQPSANVWLNDDRAAVVQLTVRIAPQKVSTFVAEVTYAAQYAIVGENPVMSIGEFASGNGLANLVPFVRAKLVQLTAESRFPTFYLQPINLTALQRSATELGEDVGGSGG